MVFSMCCEDDLLQEFIKFKHGESVNNDTIEKFLHYYKPAPKARSNEIFPTHSAFPRQRATSHAPPSLPLRHQVQNWSRYKYKYP